MARNLGNRKRFKILERDSFRCQYCGRTPPGVRLHVDHVIPVASGGTDDESNLVAACSDCNHGKFDHNVDRKGVPQDFKALAADAKERAAQLRAYRKHLALLREEIDRSIDHVGAAYYGPGFTFSYEKAKKERSQVERFLNLLGLAEVEHAARIAAAKGLASRQFHYFAGICWTRCSELGIRGKPERNDAE